MIDILIVIVAGILTVSFLALLFTYLTAWLVFRFVEKKDLESWLEDYPADQKKTKSPN